MYHKIGPRFFFSFPRGRAIMIDQIGAVTQMKKHWDLCSGFPVAPDRSVKPIWGGDIKSRAGLLVAMWFAERLVLWCRSDWILCREWSIFVRKWRIIEWCPAHYATQHGLSPHSLLIQPSPLRVALAQSPPSVLPIPQIADFSPHSLPILLLHPPPHIYFSKPVLVVVSDPETLISLKRFVPHRSVACQRPLWVHWDNW